MDKEEFKCFLCEDSKVIRTVSGKQVIRCSLGGSTEWCPREDEYIINKVIARKVMEVASIQEGFDAIKSTLMPRKLE